MTDRTAITVELDPETKRGLEALADRVHRPERELIAEAIQSFVQLQRWQMEGIERAIQNADAGGPFYAHDALRRWAESWGADDELPPPDPVEG